MMFFEGLSFRNVGVILMMLVKRYALALGNFPYSTGQVILIDGGLTLSRF
jgi:hypothetical protein